MYFKLKHDGPDSNLELAIAGHASSLPELTEKAIIVLINSLDVKDFEETLDPRNSFDSCMARITSALQEHQSFN